MADPLDLDALESLLAAATPRPWECNREPVPYHGSEEDRLWDLGPRGSGEDGFATLSSDAGADAALIVGAVNALPAHIAEIRRLRAALAKHGRHESGCYWLARDRNGEVRAVRLPCSCGLAKELEGR